MSNAHVVDMNMDLTSERIGATFDTNHLETLLYGQDTLEQRAHTYQFYQSLPELHEKIPPCFMSREERMENAIQKTTVLQKIMSELDPEKCKVRFGSYLKILTLCREGSPFKMNHVGFIPILISLGTKEQKEKWLPLAQNCAINGTFAQTELGHGTNLQKLETTATYEPTTQEFILNTPTVTATKWWSGNLGKVTNHAIVMAQLWTQGKCYGPHGFIIQIRDMETHMPMKGIKLYDLGPKMGFHSTDHGCMTIENARIPRANMLMKNSQILPNGDYVTPAHNKLNYSHLVHSRSKSVVDQARSLAVAATISIRYSCVRRQGQINTNEDEVKLLDYQTQQYRIMPQLAEAYAYWFSGIAMQKVYSKAVKEMEAGSFHLLPQLHALSCGLKSVVTWNVAQGIEQCRLACGGHGYMHASGFPELYAYAVTGCTGGGDNIVLLLQLARYLIKASRAAQEQSLIKRYGSTSSIDENVEYDDLVDAFEYVAQWKVRQCILALDHFTNAGDTTEDAWNKCSVELCKAARAHIRLFLVVTFVDTVKTIPDQATRTVMTQLCHFFILHQFSNRTGQFIENGYVNSKQVAFVRCAMYATMASLRPNAVALADSWNLSDVELRSVLGRYDGQVYPNMLKWVKHSNLNENEVLDSVNNYLLPAIKQNRAKL